MPTILEQIQALVAAGRVRPSRHGRIRRDERGIHNSDLVHGLAEAIVVELYNDPGERPAVLLLQYDRSGIPLHVIWGFDADTGDALVIATYRPGLDIWEPDLMTRRKR